jgi:hypothetical protein
MSQQNPRKQQRRKRQARKADRQTAECVAKSRRGASIHDTRKAEDEDEDDVRGGRESSHSS